MRLLCQPTGEDGTDIEYKAWCKLLQCEGVANGEVETRRVCVYHFFYEDLLFEKFYEDNAERTEYFTFTGVNPGVTKHDSYSRSNHARTSKPRPGASLEHIRQHRETIHNMLRRTEVKTGTSTRSSSALKRALAEGSFGQTAPPSTRASFKNAAGGTPAAGAASTFFSGASILYQYQVIIFNLLN